VSLSHQRSEIYLFLDDVGLDDSEDLIDSRLTHRSLAQAMQDAQPSDDWDSFLQRAERRGQAGTYTTNAEEEDLMDRTPKEGEHLWEIGCKVRRFCLVHVVSSLNSP
jgi:hypothetical protein